MERLTELNALLNMDEKDNDAIMLGDDAGGEGGEISGVEEDSEIFAAEEKAEIVKGSGVVQGSKKPSERPSLKEKLEMMK